MDAARRRRDLILTALDREPGLTHAELATHVDLPFRHLVALLWELQDAGAIVHEGRRWYPAPDRGTAVPG